MSKIKAEILSPAGNLEKLKIAVNYGADAVYGGVSHFSLRTRAGKEFTYESFLEGINYAHSKGKKFYTTINGFPFNSQLNLLKNHIAKIRDFEPDAFIVAAPGVIKLCKEIAPQIPIHLSTQANVLNVLDAEVFYDMGVKRIVAARELSLSDAVAIKERLPKLEIEIFIHGSMCFAFSGRCLISALQSGRVPNRGSCANDCRFDYDYFVRNLDNDELVPFNGRELYIKAPDNDKLMRLEEEEGLGTHIFNSKDLNLINHIKEILDSGAISALKIEGRTKSPYYVAIATRAYRAAVDDYYNGVQNLDFYNDELNTLKNRGFTDGYIVSRPYEKLNTQNLHTAISDGSYQVNAIVLECGEYAVCKHTIRVGEAKELVLPETSPLGMQCGEIADFVECTDTKSANIPQNPQSSHSHTANAGSLDSHSSCSKFCENLESSLRESEANEAIYNTESSDFDKNRSKINLHEVQQPQEASSGVRERVVREQNLSKIIGSDFAIQAPFPSLKVKSIENPCKKDSTKNENLESYNDKNTDSPRDATPSENPTPTYSQKITIFSNQIGEIFCQDSKYFIVFHTILLKDGRELDEIHSGNVNEFRLPKKLPPFSFLRQKIQDS